ncbi:MAG TPA: hypothetical protein VII75_09280 [Thermoanaerobaculia bacterium]|nr:hypothetical protein [Thermoanaerobaculia bacterium]
MNKPNWYNNEVDTGWNRVKAAFANDWEQTRHDFGSKSARELNQDVDDTVKQMAGSSDGFEKHEPAFRFGYGAQNHYRTQYPKWNSDLERQLSSDYGKDFNRDRDYIRHAYEYRYGNAPSGGEIRDERRM